MVPILCYDAVKVLDETAKSNLPFKLQELQVMMKVMMTMMSALHLLLVLQAVSKARVTLMTTTWRV